MSLLRGLDTQKATGPDDVSLHLQKRFSQELAAPLPPSLLNRKRSGLQCGRRLELYLYTKKAPGRSQKNYIPISLLSMLGKVFGRVVAEVVCDHIKDNIRPTV